MARLMNAVFLVLITSLPALARRVNLPQKVSLETETVEDSKKDAIQGTKTIRTRRTPFIDKDNLDLPAGGLEDAAVSRGATAKTFMQEVQRGDASFKEVHAHTVAQSMGGAMMDFPSALKAVSGAIYAEVKAAASAELYEKIDPGSNNARESRNEANAAAAALIHAETSLCEKTGLLAGEAFGGEAIVGYMLEGYDQSKEKTIERVLERLNRQVDQFEINVQRVGFNPKDIVGVEKLQSRLSALDGLVKAMQGQEMDSDEIDLTKPLLLEVNATYLGIAKLLPEFLKVQLNLLRKVAEKRANDQGKAVNGIELPPKLKMQLEHDDFLKKVRNMEQLSLMQSIIKNAIADFMKAKFSTPAAYRLAKEELGQAVKPTMKQLEAFDPKMKERQKAKIDEAMKEKNRQWQMY